MNAPTADVVAVRGRAVTIACPYCGAKHVHIVERLGRNERHAPACGLYRSPDQRSTGYRFQTERTRP